MRYHHIRDLVEKGVIQVDYIPSSEMIADIFTKALDKSIFEKHRTGLGIINIDQV